MKKKKKERETAKGNQESWAELTKLTKIIAAPIAIRQLEDLAKSNERRAIWILCSGRLTRNQISKKSGVSLKTVTTFVDLAMTFGLLEEEKGKGGHPRRVIDHIPSNWKSLAKKKPQKEQETANKKS